MAQEPMANSPPSAGLLLPLTSDVKALEFDLFQRYSTVAVCLDRLLAGAGTPARILEVGCNVLNMLPRFLDPARIHVTRCDVVGDAKEKDFVLLEKGKPLPFADASFDAVAALEVLEHIPAAARSSFLGECVRVARHGAVFTAPDGSPQVRDCEALWNAAFETRRGFPHPWLREHEEFGLPPAEEIVAILREFGHPHGAYGTAPLDLWLAMMMLSDNLHGEPLSGLQSRLNEAYFKGLLKGGPATYRNVYVVAKTPAAAGALRPVEPEPGTASQRSRLPEHFAPLDLMATAANEALCSFERERQLADAVLSERFPWQGAARETMLHAQALQVRTLEMLLMHAYQSTTWKAGKPLRLARRLILPRRFALVPGLHTPDLRQVPGEPEGTWVAVSSDPQFIIPCMLPRGWLRVRLKMACEVQGFVELYFDGGGGFNPMQRAELAYNLGRVDVDRHIYLDTPVRAIRFDPLTAPGKFHIEHFSIVTVPPPLALARSLRAKVKELSAPGRFTRALRIGAGLLLRGKLGDFKDKLLSNKPGADVFQPWDFPRLTTCDREQMRAEAAKLPDPPLISVLLPVYNPPENFLRLAIESVRKQIYPRWELCIADDCSPGKHVRRVLDEYAARDKRIKVVYRSQNGNISAASNSALEMATGEYTALLDHDDELAEQAFFRAAQAIVKDRTLDFLYSDEDKLDMSGRHVGPFFKPDWSPEYFLSCMYTCHLGVYRTALMREIGGFRSEYDFAQDYDMVLRLVARTQAICHIPEVLYHWRATPASTAASYTAKPKAHAVAQRALESYLKTVGREGTVEPGPVPGFHRVRLKIRGRPKVSIVIPSACRPAVIRGEQTTFIYKCVESIRRKSTYDNYEILVLYNSLLPPDIAKQLQEFGTANIAYTGEFNLARKMNMGAGVAGGEHLIFLNDDIEVISPDWIECMLECSQEEGVGVVGAKLFFPDGRLQHAGVTVLGANPKHLYYGAAGQLPGYFNSNVVQRNYSAVTGACLMSRAEVFRSVGGFTTAFPFNYNDIDYCLKVLSAGKRVVYTPYAQLYHHESATKTGTFPHEVAEFQSRWATKYCHDPYFPALAQMAAITQ